MDSEFDRVLSVLQRFISPVNAQSLLRRALQQHSLPPGALTREDLRKIDPNLRRGIEMFVDANRRSAAHSALNDVFGNSDPRQLDASVIQIVAESDIGRARAEARRVCDAIGTNPFVMQKVATIVSELGRNMVLYARGGLVRIAPANSGRRRVEIEATDDGPGIPKPKLEEIMSGRYKSRTGLGRGLIGTKQLADTFDLSSDGMGTRVFATVWV